jgi:glycosyltransferase involved in cell wall biosynthesis
MEQGPIVADRFPRATGGAHPLDVSVIICTYNRCESLRETLQTLCALEIPRNLSWELLVVDNNSPDATREVCESFQPILPLRYVFEPRQGQNNALNRSIEEAAGGLLLFTDDDVDVDRRWLISFLDAARRHPDVSFFGGKVLPRWEAPPPRWLSENCNALLRHVSTAFEMGEDELLVSLSDCVFYGANLAIRQNALSGKMKFRPDLGPCGAGQVRGGETALLREMLAAGMKGLYVPAMVVHHRNPLSRMTEQYVRAYYHGAGVTQVRLEPSGNGHRKLFGAPRYLWWKLIKHAVQYAAFRRTRPSRTWLRAEIEMATTWGRITELRRLSKQPPRPALHEAPVQHAEV